ncbi:hypothetical protein AWC11_07290 [Mycobacterium interjectum]|nr:hypothetical protein AWC11_07290 [Mycobacterium interjectum]
MTSYPGGEVLGIVAMQATGQIDALNQAIKEPVVAQYVYGCVFEPYTRGPVEEQTDVITSHERAWAFLPYVPGVGIPTVDVNGNPVVDGDGNPVPAVITNANYLQPQRPNDAQAQRNYKVQGLPEIEYDIDGVPDYAWVVCEWHGG